VRQAKLGASYGVQVPGRQGLASHLYRVLRDREGQTHRQRPTRSADRESYRPQGERGLLGGLGLATAPGYPTFNYARKLGGKMSFPVLVESEKGRFVASLVGIPNVRAAEPTRSQAILSLKAKINQNAETGKLLFLKPDAPGISTLAGKYKSDPTLRDICEEAYKKRDEEYG